MKLFVGEPDFLKGNWSAYVRSVWNRQIGGNFAPSAAFVSRNCRDFCVLSTATWDSENQDHVFSWFWRISFKEAKRRSEERYRFMLSGFLFILMVLYKLLCSCHKTWKLQNPFECTIAHNYPTQEEIKHCLAITLFLNMLQDFMAAAYTCRPQITAKEI